MFGTDLQSVTLRTRKLGQYSATRATPWSVIRQHPRMSKAISRGPIYAANALMVLSVNE